MKKLEAHQLAEMLPMMSEPEYVALRESIQQSEQSDPIELFEGKILDGRNRYRACIELKREPITTQFKGDYAAAVQRVYNRAVHRNMTDSQKAAAAVNFLPHFEKLAAERQKAALKKGDRPGTSSRMAMPKWAVGCDEAEVGTKLRNMPTAELVKLYREHCLGGSTVAINTSGPRGTLTIIKHLLETWYRLDGNRARDQAGQLFGVSGRYVSDARKIFEADKKLFREVFEGRLPVTHAIRAIKRTAKSKVLKKMVAQAGLASTGGENWKIIVGDCLEKFDQVADQSVNLIFADPPYNIGIDYGNGAKADLKLDHDFLSWCDQWLTECARVLRVGGSIFVMMGSKYADEIGCMMRNLFERRSTIAWIDTFGNYTSGNFTDCWRAIHYYTNGTSKMTWNGDEILIPSDRQTKYGDSRASAGGKVPSNVWNEFPRLVDNAAERMPGFPTQLPVALVERVIRAASNPGDLVLDPFNGSGTTGEAAIRNGRRYVGIEAIAKNAAFASARLRKVDLTLLEGV